MAGTQDTATVSHSLNSERQVSPTPAMSYCLLHTVSGSDVGGVGEVRACQGEKAAQDVRGPGQEGNCDHSRESVFEFCHLIFSGKTRVVRKTRQQTKPSRCVILGS